MPSAGHTKVGQDLPAVVQREESANESCSFRNVRVLLLFGQSAGL